MRRMQTLVGKARSAKPTKAVRLLGRVGRVSNGAVLLTNRAEGHHRITKGCADALRGLLSKAKARALTVAGDLK